MDLAGKGTGEIAAALGMQSPRISVIRNSPMYIQQREVMRSTLKSQFMDKQSDKMVTGDPVELALKDAALEAARKKIDLMRNGNSEFVQHAASSDILDRAGYKAHQDKTILSVQITEKMADRFEKAITFKRETTQQTQPSANNTTAVGETVEGGTENGGTDVASP